MKKLLQFSVQEDLNTDYKSKESDKNEQWKLLVKCIFNSLFKLKVVKDNPV